MGADGKSGAIPSNCPMHRDYKGPAAAAVAPGKEEDMSSHGYGEINPRNMMPDVQNNPLPSDNISFSRDRETSSIPKTGEKKNWVYPSPQQFYNAIRRRGKVEEDDHLEESGLMNTVVFAHNVTNERTWEEIIEWERKLHWHRCKEPTLLSFVGKSDDPSWRAWWAMKFGGHAVFDRHDWTIDRCGLERVRYVIDYYDDPNVKEDPYGLQISLVTRPAITDSFQNFKDYIKKPLSDWIWGGDKWGHGIAEDAKGGADTN